MGKRKTSKSYEGQQLPVKDNIPENPGLYSNIVRGILEQYSIDAEQAISIATQIHKFDDPYLSPFVGACESPIERLFLMGFFGITNLSYPDISCVELERTDHIQKLWFAEVNAYVSDRAERKKADYVIRISPQVVISTHDQSYRVDFLMSATDHDGKYSFVVVEVDGHEFHERTKEQVVADNQRDRDLAKGGFDVIRFSGSEVFKGRNACAVEATKILLNRLGGSYLNQEFYELAPDAPDEPKRPDTSESEATTQDPSSGDSVGEAAE